MSQETSYAVVAIFTFIGIIGNIIAFLFARIELKAQRNETKALAILASDLDEKVHRLSVDLDHRIYRLERVRDLLTGLIHTMVGLRQFDRSRAEKLDLDVKREMTFPELIALIRVINDEKLMQLADRLDTVLTDEEWPKILKDQHYDFAIVNSLAREQSDITTDMHQRVLELIKEAMQSNESNRVQKNK